MFAGWLLIAPGKRKLRAAARYPLATFGMMMITAGMATVVQARY
jgi:hypothetical protein